MGFVMPLLRRGRGAVVGAALVSGLVAFAGGFVGFEREAEAQSKIAVIDMQRAMFETEEGLRVQANLKKLLDKRQADFNSRQNDFVREKEAFEKDQQNPKIPKEKLQQKAEDLQRHFAELQQMQAEYQRDMQRQQNEMTLPLYQKIQGVVQRIASQDGYDAIFDKSVVPYIRRDLEITDRAIQMYNTGSGGSGGADTKAPATDPVKTPPAAPAKPTTDKPAPAKPAADKPAAKK